MIKAVIFDCYGVLVDVLSNRRFETVLGYIEDLHKDYKTAMISNVTGRARLDGLFEPGTLDRLFDEVFPSGDVGYEKPQHEIFELAAARLGVEPSECLFVDDIQRFCDAAAETGMQTVTFRSPATSLDDITKALGKNNER